MSATTHQPEDLVRLFQTGTKLTFKKGEFIIRPGEPPSGVFYIQSGLVKAYDISKYGEENMLVIRKAGEIFPIIWAVTGQERDIVYQALDNMVLWRISSKTYRQALDENPEITWHILNLTIEMYRIHSEHIMTLEYRTVRERLISFLLTMEVRFGESTADGVLIAVPLKQQDIASSINTSRETASRELVRLERLKLIKTQQFCVTLLDKQALQAVIATSK